MNKKIFIEVPTWLGDCIMTTPAIENIITAFPNCEITLFSSFVSSNLFLYHPNVKNIIIDTSKKSGFRYLNLYNFAKNSGEFDIAFSFRKNFTTKFLLQFVNAKEKYIYQRYTKVEKHQVQRYNDFINLSLNIDSSSGDLKIYLKDEIKKENNLPTLGLNPGATYGSAKRWYPQEFAKVAIELSSKYNIKIFGGPDETNIAGDIESILKENNINNYENLAGKTSVEELIYNISALDLFITNDSGPMHVAAAFKVRTISIFGPTKHIETSQWNNPKSKIIKKDFDCMPCMKRICPLSDENNHQCMKEIKAKEVLEILASH